MKTETKNVKYQGKVVATLDVQVAEDFNEAVKISGSKEKALAEYNYGHTVKMMNAARQKAALAASGGVPKSIAKMLGNDPEKIAEFKRLVGLED